MFAGVARGATAKDRSADIHVAVDRGISALGVVSVAVDINVGIAGDGRLAESSAVEVTVVGTRIDVLVDDEGILLIVVCGTMMRRVVDGILSDEGINGAVGVAEVTRGEHVLFNVAAHDVDSGADGSGGVVSEAARWGGKCGGVVVGLTAAAIHGTGHIAVGGGKCGIVRQTHVDGLLTCHVDLASGAQGAAIDVLLDETTTDVDGGVALCGAFLAAAIHEFVDGATADGDGGADGSRGGTS